MNCICPAVQNKILYDGTYHRRSFFRFRKFFGKKNLCRILNTQVIDHFVDLLTCERAVFIDLAIQGKLVNPKIFG